MPELTTLDCCLNDGGWKEPTDKDLDKIELEEKIIIDRLSYLTVSQACETAKKSTKLLKL